MFNHIKRTLDRSKEIAAAFVVAPERRRKNIGLLDERFMISKVLSAIISRRRRTPGARH